MRARALVGPAGAASGRGGGRPARGAPLSEGKRSGCTVGAGRCGTPERRSDHAAKELQVHRLGEVVIGTGLQRLDRALRRAVGGDDDCLLAPSGLLQAAQQVEAATVGQPHVGDDGTEGAVAQLRPCVLDAAGGFNVVAFAQQGQLVESAQVRLVVDDQQAEVGRRAHQCTLRAARWTQEREYSPRATHVAPSWPWRPCGLILGLRAAHFGLGQTGGRASSCVAPVRSARRARTGGRWAAHGPRWGRDSLSGSSARRMATENSLRWRSGTPREPYSMLAP